MHVKNGSIWRDDGFFVFSLCVLLVFFFFLFGGIVVAAFVDAVMRRIKALCRRYFDVVYYRLTTKCVFCFCFVVKNFIAFHSQRNIESNEFLVYITYFIHKFVLKCARVQKIKQTTKLLEYEQIAI